MLLKMYQYIKILAISHALVNVTLSKCNGFEMKYGYKLDEVLQLLVLVFWHDLVYENRKNWPIKK